MWLIFRKNSSARIYVVLKPPHSPVAVKIFFTLIVIIDSVFMVVLGVSAWNFENFERNIYNINYSYQNILHWTNHLNVLFISNILFKADLKTVGYVIGGIAAGCAVLEILAMLCAIKIARNSSKYAWNCTLYNWK